MTLITIATLTPDEEARAQDFILAQCLKRTKHKGDAAWREAAQITADGDYTPGFDDGSHPSERYGA
jgi:hypothetical protein